MRNDSEGVEMKLMNAGRGLGHTKVSIADGKKLLTIQVRDENFGLAGRILNFIAGGHPL